MKLETLQERIKSIEDKIAKKQGTIVKKRATAEKYTKKLSAGVHTGQEAWSINYTIKTAYEDIERLENEIIELQSKLEKYNSQMGDALAEDAVIKSVPPVLKQLQMELVERWDEYDIRRRNKVREDYANMSYKDFIRQYRTAATAQLRFKTDEQIHNENMRDAEKLIIDLIYRVRNITGEITSWEGVRATCGSNGCTVLNGRVQGKEGVALVESIGAGGYNIQRYHIRVLVKSL